MAQRIRVADLPEFDPSLFLGSDEAVAAYLADILEANNPALLVSALGDISPTGPPVRSGSRGA